MCLAPSRARLTASDSVWAPAYHRRGRVVQPRADGADGRHHGQGHPRRRCRVELCADPRHRYAPGVGARLRSGSPPRVASHGLGPMLTRALGALAVLRPPQTFGEDPYVASEMGSAIIRGAGQVRRNAAGQRQANAPKLWPVIAYHTGMQGFPANLADPSKVAACMKVSGGPLGSATTPCTALTSRSAFAGGRCARSTAFHRVQWLSLNPTRRRVVTLTYCPLCVGVHEVQLRQRAYRQGSHALVDPRPLSAAGMHCVRLRRAF